jgi:hypothetical protein
MEMLVQIDNFSSNFNFEANFDQYFEQKSYNFIKNIIGEFNKLFKTVFGSKIR